MVWLWPTFEEYKDRVQPAVLDRIGQFRHSHLQTWFEAQGELHNSAEELEAKNRELRALIFDRKSEVGLVEDPAILDHVHRLVIDIAHAGENLLLHHRRLGMEDAAYGFATQHGILEHWERYSGTKRIYREIAQLTEDTDTLVAGFRETKHTDASFLVGVLDLPLDLMADFRTACNLFSVGFEEAGVLLAGRGLEGVLRRIALTRKLKLRNKGKDAPAFEADLYDLIELCYRINGRCLDAG